MVIVSRCFTLHHTKGLFSVREVKLTNTASTCDAGE